MLSSLITGNSTNILGERGDAMKRRLTKISIVMVIVILAIIYYFPKPLYKIVIPNCDITIMQIVINVVNGFPEQEPSTYQFLPNTDSYDRVVSIFSKYTYHRNLRSLFLTNGLDCFKDHNFCIYFNNDLMKSVKFRGTGEIIINNHSYSMGKSEQISFMDEIESLLSTLSTETPISQS